MGVGDGLVAGSKLVEDRGQKDPPQLEAGRGEAIGDHAPGFEASEPVPEPESDGQLVLAVRFRLLGRPLQINRHFVRRPRSLVGRA